MPELKVKATDTGERLDRFLATAQTDLSRSQIQLLIRAGRVEVNGGAARASHKLREGDTVAYLPPEPRVLALEPEDIALSVVHEDADLLVLDKPAGLVVHPGAGVSRGTLVHALLHRHPGIADVGGEGRPGIVHRLDKDTSGLMVVARTPRAYRALVEMIRRREVHRTYRALVWGAPGAERGEVTAAIGRDPRNRKRMTVVQAGGKPARSHWRVIERFGRATLLEVALDTGRTHQIRVHLESIGLPIVGDRVYRGRGNQQLRAVEAQRSLASAVFAGLDRQALHAARLEFRHPETGERLRFESPVPDDFAQALRLLAEDRDRARG
jgi:23S rRNA pseudouridine1911/1915/1917 synthase